MASRKTALKTPSRNATLEGVSPIAVVTDEAPEHRAKRYSFEFKIEGGGTSDWMSFVKENGKWVKLRPSDTSFISAVTAIEPEVMRLAFPHTITNRKTA